ncbi:MAG: hypothetical protein KC493_03830 [Bacteriovoracaceae bacterium]|nr:hypothetical protein [Bacteriovoracaceae bacterium]
MISNNQWILTDPKKDFLYILFPGLIAAVYFLSAEADNYIYEILAFIVMGLIDSGHVYSTLWRTYFHKDERSSSKRYIWIPLSVFVIGFIWFYFQFKWLYSFIFYITAYHHLRQYFGVVKWYEKLEGQFTKWSGRFLYILSLCPAIAAHFRSDLIIEFYTKSDVLMYPNKNLFQLLIIINIIVMLSYLIYEYFNYKRGEFLLNRTLSVILPVTLYTLVFYLGKDGFQILLPLMVAHGVPYYAMLGQSLIKTRRDRFPNYKVVWKAIFLTAVVFGGFEFYFERELIDFDLEYLFVAPTVWESLLLGVYVIPLMSHYLIDAYIWRSHHREGRLIYQ